MCDIEFSLRTKTALAYINCKRNKEYNHLRLLQVESLKKATKGDTISVLPTGYGKSLIFELLQAFTRKVVIICSPLNSIIEEQTLRYGSDACHVSPTVAKTARFTNAEYNFVIGHPEELLNDDVLAALTCPTWEKAVGHIVIDEAHCVVSWGANFRKKFAELGKLRSIFPSSSILCLTATATKDMRDSITKTLGLINPSSVVGPVNRDNIKLCVLRRPPTTGGNNTSEDSFEQVLAPYIDELVSGPSVCPKTIVYCKLKYCGLGYELAIHAGNVAKMNLRPHVSQYHAPCTQEEKSAIISDLQKENGLIRLLFATEAYSMGTDAPNIRRILHVGVPNNMEAYIQEVGRAGRDELLSEATMFYNNNDLGANIKELKNVMRDFCRASTCRRSFIDHHFGVDSLNNVEPSLCCDICDSEHSPEVMDNNFNKITVGQFEMTTMDIALHEVLLSYFKLENNVVSTLSNPAVLTGLSTDLARDIASLRDKQDIGKFLEQEEYLKEDYVANILSIVDQLCNNNC